MAKTTYTWSVYHYPPSFPVYLLKKAFYIIGIVAVLTSLSYFLIDVIVAIVIGFFSFLGSIIVLFFMNQIMSGKNINYLIDHKGVSINNSTISYEKIDKIALLNKIKAMKLPEEKWQSEKLQEKQRFFRINKKMVLEFSTQKSRQQALATLENYLS